MTKILSAALCVLLFLGAFAYSQEKPVQEPGKEAQNQVGQSGEGQAGQNEPQGQAAENKDAEQTGQAKQDKAKDYCKGKKKKDCVDAIGDRNMEKRGLGNWYSLEKEISIGRAMAQEVEAGSRMVTDPVVNEYINRIGQNLVRNSDAKVPFTIKVIDDDSINAFALPGGFFYVNTGTILAADDEDELAGVMAHEIAHVAARHATRQATRGNWANLATIPLIFVGGPAGYWARQGARILLPLAFVKFSRGFESEADHLGVEYMYKAGYDPNGLVSFFEKVQAKEKKKPGILAKAFETHPQTPDRIAATQKEIAEILPPRDQYLVTTSEFDEVKARLAAIENSKKVAGAREKQGPSLRRKSGKDCKEGDKDCEKSKEEDRPKLERRN